MKSCQRLFSLLLLMVMVLSCFAGSACAEGCNWYEIFVRSYRDTDDDGIGDFCGVEYSLPYIASLGIDGIYKMGHRTQILVDEPEKIERVKGIPSSKHLAERSEYFRQKVWNLKQIALGQQGAILPVAAETPEEVVPEESK